MKRGIYKTRDGRAAAVASVVRCGQYPVHGEINGIPHRWTLDGSYFNSLFSQTSGEDLIERIGDLPRRSRLPRIYLVMFAYAVILLSGTVAAIVLDPYIAIVPLDSKHALLLAFIFVWAREADK